MERKYDDEFIKWVLVMLKKYHLTRKELGNRVCIETSYMNKILRGECKATKKTKYLIIDFFEREYNESFVSSEKNEDITFGAWLDRVMVKHRIDNFMIAKELDVCDSRIHSLRRGLIELNILQRKSILGLLERNYKVDISQGMALLDNTVNKYYKEMGEWICNAMKSSRISDDELLQHIDISKTTIYFITSGKMLLCYERAEKLFEFFEQRGIDTEDGRKKYKEAMDYKKSY